MSAMHTTHAATKKQLHTSTHSRYYQTVLKNSSISHLKQLYHAHIARGDSTRAAFVALAIIRLIGPYSTARVLGPYVQLRTLMQIVWLECSRYELPTFLRT